MSIREIECAEIELLRGCIEELSAHHNRVSVHFAGTFPSRPYSVTLSGFRGAVNSGLSKIAAAEENGEIAGFCKIDLEQDHGKLDYLIVREEFRGRGYGSALMDWAMAQFREREIRQIEVKVIDGNDAAIRLYEKYGFRMQAHIMKIQNP